MSKRKLKITTILTLIITITLSLTAVSANVSTRFNLSATKTTVKRGDKVVLKVRSTNTADIVGGFNTYDGTLGYDTGVLSINAPKPSISGWVPVYNPKTNRFLASDPTAMDFKKQDLEVFTIEVDVLESAPLGDTVFELSDLAITDSRFRNIRLPNTNITLTIKDKEEVVLSKNNSLKGVEISDGSGSKVVLSPSFSPTNTQYTAKVKDDQKFIDVSALVSDSKSAIVSGGGRHNLVDGSNKIDIVVRAEDGSLKTYTINIDKPKTQPDKPADPDDKNPTNPDDKNPSDPQKPDTPTDKDPSNPSNGGSSGDVNVDININNDNTNNNNNSNTNTNDNKGSSNNFISDLQGLGNLDKPFNKNHNIYNTVVGKETSFLDLKIYLEDPNATYEVIGADNLSIGISDVIIKVTAENGEERDYVISVNRTDQRSEALLATMNIGGYAINPGFRENQMFYNLVVPSNVETLGVTATAKYGGASINVSGQDKINPGLNYLKIAVEADGLQNTYVVEVIREPVALKFNYWPWALSGFFALVSMGLLIALIFSSKNDRNNNNNNFNTPPPPPLNYGGPNPYYGGGPAPYWSNANTNYNPYNNFDYRNNYNPNYGYNPYYNQGGQAYSQRQDLNPWEHFEESQRSDAYKNKANYDKRKGRHASY